MVNEYIIEKLTTYFTKGLEDPSSDNIDILRDGITVLVLNIPKTIALLVIAALLGKFQQILIVLIFYGIIRGFSKGVHAKSALGCLLAGMTNYFAIVFLYQLFNVSHLVYTIIFVICFALYAVYAPSAMEARPVGKLQYKYLKIATLITLIIYCIIGNLYLDSLGNLILLSVISQLIFILPITFKVTNQKGGVIYEN